MSAGQVVLLGGAGRADAELDCGLSRKGHRMSLAVEVAARLGLASLDRSPKPVQNAQAGEPAGTALLG